MITNIKQHYQDTLLINFDVVLNDIKTGVHNATSTRVRNHTWFDVEMVVGDPVHISIRGNVVIKVKNYDF